MRDGYSVRDCLIAVVFGAAGLFTAGAITFFDYDPSPRSVAIAAYTAIAVSGLGIARLMVR